MTCKLLFLSDLDVKPESIDQSVTTTATGAATGTVTSSGNHATSHLAYLHQLQSKQIALAEGMLRLLQDLGMELLNNDRPFIGSFCRVHSADAML